MFPNPITVTTAVYFTAGLKYPMLIMDDFEYCVQEKRETSIYWRCTQASKNHCHARLLTFGKTVRIKSSAPHNHLPTFKGEHANLLRENFIVQQSRTVHFAPGRKHPIMIIDGYEYKLQLRNDTKSNWCCTQDNKYRCKVRLMATGNLVQIKDCEHTHDRTFKGNYEDLRSHSVTLEYTKKFRRLY
ncbi:hypothetical protein GWI33_002749 [Rhynchophorus ferrugineus]|uniref:FLYWCH-type domain-containing protein n=1 Tax=Rhynchophorus ferrugineus TaxID=354439 RepID=A0A834IYD2_RHYFE|nr:hypothetical protein GWI33_002749 [Rhynchophorus ferrugineus]